MTIRLQLTAGIFGVMLLAASTGLASGNGGPGDGRFCMDVEIEPFHMVPGPMVEPGACPARDYWDGELQKAFYPFTIEDHRFNCESEDFIVLPVVGMVPTWVVSAGEEPGMPGEIVGTVDGHPFSATLLCASMTNWYEQFCDDPQGDACFQLAQPFLKQGLPFPRVTEVSVIDGVITVGKGKHGTVEVPVVMATRAAGITHVEDPTAPLVGASITHSLLGMVTYEDDEDDAEVLDGSVDLLLQGHIFFPGTVEEDVDDDGNNKAAVIKGTICSKDLYRLLKRKGRKGGSEEDDD